MSTHGLNHDHWEENRQSFASGPDRIHSVGNFTHTHTHVNTAIDCKHSIYGNTGMERNGATLPCCAISSKDCGPVDQE